MSLRIEYWSCGRCRRSGSIRRNPSPCGGGKRIDVYVQRQRTESYSGRHSEPEIDEGGSGLMQSPYARRDLHENL